MYNVENFRGTSLRLVTGLFQVSAQISPQHRVLSSSPCVRQQLPTFTTVPHQALPGLLLCAVSLPGCQLHDCPSICVWSSPSTGNMFRKADILLFHHHINILLTILVSLILDLLFQHLDNILPHQIKQHYCLNLFY